jgi:polyribonucleotide nucleotidyltransferase
MKSKQYSLDLGNGQILTADFNDLAENAHGSVLVRLGNTAVLATAVMSKGEKDSDYFPLSVEYEERFYASGQILGSRFMRREGRPSDEAVLSGRIIDRTIRPLFDHRIRREVQVIITVLSLDEYDPDILGVIAASLALGTSNIPWNGPVSALRIGKIKGSDELILNPTYEQRKSEDMELDLVACGREGTINMIEVGAKEAPEAVIMQGLTYAAEVIEKIEKFQSDIIGEIGKRKTPIEFADPSAEVLALFNTAIEPKMKGLLGFAGKEKIYELEDEWLKLAKEKFEDADGAALVRIYHEAINDFVHSISIEGNKRIDGREFDEIRSLYAQAGGISPVIHGTGIFYRGGTHILSALTLGAPGEAQIVDGMKVKQEKRFMHHYNFPPFSSGETGRSGITNRRAIGHGALAEKALVPILPAKEVFPYTIRIVSEALSSNGSTSMASVCGSSLALMDAGVPIAKPVAGIASGLMMLNDTKYKILTDIQGPEDEHGDMDFKVAGTKDGVTAMQMDVKVGGIPLFILKESLEKAKQARLKILAVMEAEIAAPRADLSARAPRILVTKIKPDQIGLIIGTGGKTINEIKDATGVEIDIEEDGTVCITGESVGANEAKKIIESMTHEYKAGDRLEGEVVRVADFGVIVKLGRNSDGMVHVSEIAPFRIDKVENYLKIGMKVPVLIKGLDDKGRLKLSIKDAAPELFRTNKV